MSYLLTTVDNPYDPRVDFKSWYTWDESQGYHTPSYLARVASISDDYPPEVQERQIEIAMDEIIMIHNGGLYKKLPYEEGPLIATSGLDEDSVEEESTEAMKTP